MDSRSECIAKAALCVDRMKTDPARREYWINETIRWLERAAKLRDSGDPASRHEAAGSIRLTRVGIRAALGMSIRATPEHPIATGFHAGAAILAGPGEAEFQKFAHGRGPRRHAVLETEIIQDSQLLRRQHHLESFVANVVHGKIP